MKLKFVFLITLVITVHSTNLPDELLSKDIQCSESINVYFAVVMSYLTDDDSSMDETSIDDAFYKMVEDCEYFIDSVEYLMNEFCAYYGDNETGSSSNSIETLRRLIASARFTTGAKGFLQELGWKLADGLRKLIGYGKASVNGRVRRSIESDGVSTGELRNDFRGDLRFFPNLFGAKPTCKSDEKTHCNFNCTPLTCDNYIAEMPSYIACLSKGTWAQSFCIFGTWGDCQCHFGLVRDLETGKCIPPEYCPKKNGTTTTEAVSEKTTSTTIKAATSKPIKPKTTRGSKKYAIKNLR